MLDRSAQHYRARAQVAKALGHPSRLLMLEALRKKARCVSELTALVGADQSTVSKHLAILRNAGLVDDRKCGTQIYYSLDCDCLDGLFGCIATIVRKNAAVQACLMKCCGLPPRQR